jgi:hypothetical protein
VRPILVLVLALSSATAAGEGGDKQPTAAEHYKSLLKRFNEAAHANWNATTDEERKKAAARVATLPPKLLDLAEKNPRDPFALDALIQVVNLEIWLENYGNHTGWGKDSRSATAIALLLRDHDRNSRLGQACRRIAYGFRRECETFLRTVLDTSPHRDVQALACLGLAQFLNSRLQRLDLVQGQPELAKRYEALFGKDYLGALQRQDRARAVQEVDAFFVRAADKYGDVKLAFGGTVGERAKAELFELRHLAIGKEAAEIEGDDQDGKRFRLSDYRGKVVLLYFWQQL